MVSTVSRATMAGANRALVGVLSALEREQVAADAAAELLAAERTLSECYQRFTIWTTDFAEDDDFEEKIDVFICSVWYAIRDVVRLQMTSHAGHGQSVTEAIVDFAGEFTGGMDLNTLD